MTTTSVGLLLLSCLISIAIGQVTITTDPVDATVKVGENFTITCNSGSAITSPTLNINGAPFTNEVTDISPPNSIQELTFKLNPSARRIDNGQIFSCSASGVTTTPVVLNVTFPPIISIDLMVTSGSVGDQATVNFTVDANPQVVANGISLNRAGADNIDVNDDQVNITFSNLMRSDAGDYVVTVTNSEGSDVVTFRLNVFFGPNFLQPSDTINAIVGITSLTINCSVESNPPATVTFTTTANATSNVAINPTTGIVTITNTVLGNTGDYTCIANNTLISTTQTFNVNIGNAPNLQLTYGTISYNMTHIMIPYTITTSNIIGSIRQYTVSCTNCPAGYTMISFAPPLPNPVVIPISELPCGTTYTISISATNEFGSAVVASGSFTTDDCVTPTPSTSPTDDSIGLVGTTTTAVLVVLLGIIAAVFVN